MAAEKDIFNEDLAPYFTDLADERLDDTAFDEEAYLKANPELGRAIAEGHFPNALFHYRIYGHKEGRFPHAGTPPVPRQSAEIGFSPVRDNQAKPSVCHIDNVTLSQNGGVFFVGWSDDLNNKIKLIRLSCGGRNFDTTGAQLLRFRRRDVEDALGAAGGRSFGFCGFIEGKKSNTPTSIGGPYVITVVFENGAATQIEIAANAVRIIDDVSLLETLLGYFAGLEFCGNKFVESFNAIDGYLGHAIVSQNRNITRSIVAGSSCTHFGMRKKKPRGSIVVCLYGKPEYLFLQNALFSGAPGMEDYEFIYVCNSPELIENLHKIAATSQRVYDLPLSIVSLPGNAGFGGANNAAARYANSDRLLFVNPDVVPVRNDWALLHNQIVEQKPADETWLFGSRLFYADGSLMHAGMYYEIDWGVSISDFEIRRRPMIRVEHYGKGSPASAFLPSRPVPAVSGAFISVDRRLYERLGGFSEDVVYGHYEDADLCLRAMSENVTPWVHDIPLWHLEGKGSTRRAHHEGASLVNRWLFTKTWYDKISRELVGPTVALGAPTKSTTAPPAPVAEAAPAVTAAPEAATAPAGRRAAKPKKPSVPTVRMA